MERLTGILTDELPLSGLVQQIKIDTTSRCEIHHQSRVSATRRYITGKDLKNGRQRR